MPTFRPPTTAGYPVGRQDDPGWTLWRHFGAWETGQTVWKDTEGAWHTALHPPEGGSTTTTHDRGTTTTAGPTEGLATAEKVYLGGHTYTISTADADELVAAGFDVDVCSESFNKADGELGPDLTWDRQYLFGDFSYAVEGNEAVFFTDTPGFHEDFRVPSPNVSSPDVTMSIDVTDLTRSGSGGYTVGVGFAARLRTNPADAASYDAYTLEFIRTTVFGPEGYALVINKLEAYPAVGGTSANVLDVVFVSVGDLALPATLTFTTAGSTLTGTCTHAGTGGPLEVSAVDGTFPTGLVAVGCAHETVGSDTARHAFDNFIATEIV